MSLLTRRNFIKTTAAGLALPALGGRAFAAEPLKVGFVYLGAIGDYGWTWSHDQGRKQLQNTLKGQVITNYVENVKEDASAIPIMKDLAQQGNKLIFTTSYGYMDQTLEAAKAFPDVKWEHCTGYKRADNVGTYNSRFYQGRAVIGTIAGMMSKTNTIGFVGSFKIPEVVMGVNAFTLAAQAANPKIATKLVMIDTWFDPAKEAAAAETLANLGCDVIAQHVDSPAVLQVCEKRKIYGFGYGADMAVIFWVHGEAHPRRAASAIYSTRCLVSNADRSVFHTVHSPYGWPGAAPLKRFETMSEEQVNDPNNRYLYFPPQARVSFSSKSGVLAIGTP